MNLLKTEAVNPKQCHWQCSVTLAQCVYLLHTFHLRIWMIQKGCFYFLLCWNDTNTHTHTFNDDLIGLWWNVASSFEKICAILVFKLIIFRGAWSKKIKGEQCSSLYKWGRGMLGGGRARPQPPSSVGWFTFPLSKIQIQPPTKASRLFMSTTLHLDLMIYRLVSMPQNWPFDIQNVFCFFSGGKGS